MEITIVMAEQFVDDVEAAEHFYTRVLGRGPDARPMDGLLEWHVAGCGGLQVFRDPARAGGTSMTLGVTDLEAAVRDLDAAGLEHGEPWGATYVRVVELNDPSGNGVVLTQPLEA